MLAVLMQHGLRYKSRTYHDLLTFEAVMKLLSLQNTVQREGVQQMHCFRHLPQQLQEAGEAVQQLMSSDLLSLVRAQSGGAALQDPLLASIMQNQEIQASG